MNIDTSTTLFVNDTVIVRFRLTKSDRPAIYAVIWPNLPIAHLRSTLA